MKYIIIILILSIIFSVSNYLASLILNYDQLIVKSIEISFTEEQISNYLTFKSKARFIIFLIYPFWMGLKISIIAAILDAGCFFFSKEIKYKKLFNIVVKAEFIFLLVIVFKTAWFYFFKTDYNLEDLQYFYPLSALNIIGYEGLQPWFIYPFQILNLFELFYWFILAYLIGKEINDTESTKGMQIVASSYGVGLLIWVVGVMFFTLNMS